MNQTLSLSTHKNNECDQSVPVQAPSNTVNEWEGFSFLLANLIEKYISELDV